MSAPSSSRSEASAESILVLSGRVGVRRKVQGKVASVTWYPALKVLETHVLLEEGWNGHAAGQFAFVTSDGKEGPHPYTIAPAWRPDSPQVTFITKALGDYTSCMPGNRFQIPQSVRCDEV